MRRTGTEIGTLEMQSRVAIAGVLSVTLAALPITVVGQVSPIDAAPIASSEAGALIVPDEWDCEKIIPEYRAFLDAGNSPDDWQYVGKTYLNVDTGETYTWSDWVNWVSEKKCVEEGLVSPEILPVLAPTGLIAAAVAASGTGLVAVANGSGPKSPG